jgi:predicted phosphodiesterase
LRALALLQAEGATFLFHCGDFTTTEIVHACGVLPFACVLGNNDFDEPGIRAAVEVLGGTFLGTGGEVNCEGRRIAATHGDNSAIFRKLSATRPDYLLFGHSHVPFDERDGPTRQINPGALHRANPYTVALLDTAADTVRFLVVE